ncbi:MAG: Cytosol aminopeptidase [Myxococcota bacterium]|nr:Cytosol aminopeptidase [Myxococcota bacterium]
MGVKLASGSLSSVKADLAAIVVYQDESLDAALPEGVPGELQGWLESEARRLEFKGKEGESVVVHAHGLKLGVSHVALVGAGKPDGSSLASRRHSARYLGATALKLASRLKVGNAAVFGLGRDNNPLDAEAAQAFTEGVLLSSYRFDKYRTRDVRKNPPPEVHLVAGKPAHKALQAGVDRGTILAEATCYTRDLTNTPAADMKPQDLTAQAKQIAKESGGAITVKVFGNPELKKMGCGLLLSVNLGSPNPAQLIVLEYKPKTAPKGRKGGKTVALVGKGITFDTGGLDLKPPDSMAGMKYDMSGAGAVLGAMKAIAALKPDFHVIGCVSATENCIDGGSIKPSDVMKSYKGLTIENDNTDAEGRLVLADALAYIEKTYKPDAIVDMATLTGACMIALGLTTSGVFSDDDQLAADLIAAGKLADEDHWRLPLNTKLLDAMKSDIADWKNTGNRYGGAIYGALFLRQFVDTVHWAHIDIAGPAKAEKEDGPVLKGGSGHPVRTLLEWLVPPAYRV